MEKELGRLDSMRDGGAYELRSTAKFQSIGLRSHPRGIQPFFFPSLPRWIFPLKGSRTTSSERARRALCEARGNREERRSERDRKQQREREARCGIRQSAMKTETGARRMGKQTGDRSCWNERFKRNGRLNNWQRGWRRRRRWRFCEKRRLHRSGAI